VAATSLTEFDVAANAIDTMHFDMSRCKDSTASGVRKLLCDTETGTNPNLYVSLYKFTLFM
jgi:hypothetical protein